MASLAAATPNEYVASSRRVFEQILDRGAQAGSLDSFHHVGFEDSRDVYREEMQKVLHSVLRAFGSPEDTELRRKASSASFYDKGLPVFVSSFLFWIWENRAPMTDSEMSSLVESIMEGTLGYRLIDLHLDDQTMGAEAVVLGNYLVRKHECRLAALFGEGASWPVLQKYTEMYAQVEFLEKSHRWKPCPFSPGQAGRLGWKGAPLNAVLHFIMRRAGKPEKQIDLAADAMTRIGAAFQFDDDLKDALSDLSNGIETLVMSGFYAWNQGHVLNENRVREFMDPARTRSHVLCRLDLLNSAIRDFDGLDEPILATNAERIKNRLLRSITMGRSIRIEMAAGEMKEGYRVTDVVRAIQRSLQYENGLLEAGLHQALNHEEWVISFADHTPQDDWGNGWEGY